ncbi:MAG TPA: LacI family DNA-binding transcriptional regulator [Mycobacterium sp.]
MSEQVGPMAKKRPAISDVALEAGVSKAAVSKVIRNAYGVSPAMRQKVEEAIDRLAYRPRVAARVMRGASFTVGFEVPHLGNDFFTQVTEGAASTLAGSGYQMIIAPGLGYLSGTSVLDALVDRQVDGIIAISSDVDADWLERLAANVPVVLLGRHDQSQEYDTVTDDDVAGVDMVMDHLFQLGHQRIVHLTNRPPTDMAPQAFRLEAYRRRMDEAGLEPHVVFTPASEHDAYDTARTLLEAHDPATAIFAGNDTLAIGALRAIADLGRTADDVSVVGYDNIDLAAHPLISLTSVDQFGVQMGKTAIDLLMERIRDGRSDPKHHRIDPELRIRNSSRAVHSG